MSIQVKDGWPVGADVVYAEMYQEMRRIRDYELSFAKWSMTLLISVAGGFLALTSRGLPPTRGLRFSVYVVLCIIASGASSVVWYAHTRYEEMRKFMDSQEPIWQIFNDEREKRIWKPYLVTQILIWALLIATIALVYFVPNAISSSPNTNGIFL
jgi:hypothetical protein